MQATPIVLQHDTRVNDPNLDHIPREHYQSALYEPSDDSFLFMEAIERDLNTMRFIYSLQYPTINGTTSQMMPKILEMGPGTGILSTFTHNILAASLVLPPASISLQYTSNTSTDPIDSSSLDTSTCPSSIAFTPYTIALDINPLAIEVTSQTYKSNNITACETHVSNLLSSFPAQHQGSIDLLLFNPPYVPTEEYEHQNLNQGDMIMNAYAGGAKGRVILDRLIPYIPSLFHSHPSLTLSSPKPHQNNGYNNFIFYCVFLWPHNDITGLNAMMTASLQAHFTTNCPNSTLSPLSIEFKSHLIMARQCGLEALAIVRYIPGWTFDALPTAYQIAHPLATEENMQAVFKPKLQPYVHNITAVNNVIKTNEENKKHVQNSNIASSNQSSDLITSESDSSAEDGFSLF